MVAGDMWINNEPTQLYFFDGTDLELAGPYIMLPRIKKPWVGCYCA